MANLARYRTTLGVLAIVLLVGVVGIFGDDKQATPDVATTSIVTRLHSRETPQPSVTTRPYEAVATQNDTAGKWWAASPGSQSDSIETPDSTANPDEVQSDMPPGAPPPPDPGMVHK